MADAYLRGGLGTQILSFLLNLSVHGRSLRRVFYNHSEVLQQQKIWDYSYQKNQYIDSCLNTHTLQHISSTSGKTRLTPKAIEHILINRDNILPLVNPKSSTQTFSESVLHVRKKDFDTIQDEIYVEYIKRYNIKNIITDDKDYCKKFNLNIEPLTDIEEWLSLANSKIECLGGYSTFTLSAAFMNPDLNLKIIPSDYWHCGQEAATSSRIAEGMQFVDLFVTNLKNVEYAK